jgi:hypothetical protein
MAFLFYFAEGKKITFTATKHVRWLAAPLILAFHADTTFEAPWCTIAACIAFATPAHCCKSTIPFKNTFGKRTCTITIIIIIIIFITIII